MNSVPNDFWFNKLVESNIALQECKDEMTTKYINPKLTKEQLEKAVWKADFINQELEVTVNE